MCNISVHVERSSHSDMACLIFMVKLCITNTSPVAWSSRCLSELPRTVYKVSLIECESLCVPLIPYNTNQFNTHEVQSGRGWRRRSPSLHHNFTHMRQKKLVNSCWGRHYIILVYFPIAIDEGEAGREYHPHLNLAAIVRPTDPIAKNHKGRTDIWPCRVLIANTTPHTTRITVNKRTKQFRTMKRPSHRMIRAGTLTRESSCCHGGIELSRSSPKRGVCTLPSMLFKVR